MSMVREPIYRFSSGSAGLGVVSALLHLATIVLSMPRDPVSVLHRCRHMASTWHPPNCAAELVGPIQGRQVIPFTQTFCNLDNKDAKVYGDCRAGEAIVVDYVIAGDIRGFANQAAVLLLCADYEGRVAAKASPLSSI